jgi:hypothetical protein
MKNNGNVFLGAILVSFGVLMLGVVNDWFQFEVSMREIAKYWPILIIIGGIAVFFTPKRTVFNPTTALLVAFAIPLAIYNASTTAIDNVKAEINDDFDFDVEMDDNDDNFTFDSDSSSSSNSSQNFSVPFDQSVQEVNLEIGGGAAEFFLSEAAGSDVFSAETKLFENKFNLEDEKKGTTQEISFKMSSKNGSDNIRIGKGMNNDVNLKLSKAPIWNLDLGIGAGELKFDLSDYKVKDIKMETGAADISLKMGDKLKESKVKIESGVAKVKVMVPRNAACQIKMDGALNAKDFDGFSKSGSGTWKTENFETATNKIYLEIKSGLSAVSVDRY